MADPVSIKANLRAAFRDFAVDGVPASGPSDPPKPLIRSSLGELVDYTSALASSVTSGVKGYPTFADLPTLTAGDDGELAKVEEDGAVYRWDGIELEWVAFDDTTLAAAAQAAADAIRAEQVADDFSTSLGGLLTDEEFFGAPITSRDGTVMYGPRFDGSVLILTSRPFTDADFETALIDENGVILAGRRWGGAWENGPFFDLPTGLGSQVMAVIDGAAPNRRALLLGASVIPLTFGEVDPAAVEVRGSRAIYAVIDGATASTVEEDLLALNSLASGTSRVRHRILFGQSLSNGVQSSPVLTTTAAHPGRVVMPRVGIRALGTSQSGSYATTPLMRSNLFEWVDAYEVADGSTAETPGSGLGSALTGAYPTDEAILLTAHGIGGAAYAAIKKGTVPYANLMLSVRRAFIMSRLLGLDYDVSVHLVHGEADQAAAQGVYKAALEELQADLTTDIQAVTGQSGDVPLYVSQMSAFAHYGSATSFVPSDMAAAARDNPGQIILAGPRYRFPTADGVHLTNAASYALGDMHGRAEARVLASAPSALIATSAVRSGATITVACTVPVAPLVRDTTTVTDPAGDAGAPAGLKYGFRYAQTGGTARTVSNVTVSGTTITVTLSGDPGSPSAESLRIAMDGVVDAPSGPTTGPRACIRDSATGTDAHGFSRANWICADILPVTV